LYILSVYSTTLSKYYTIYYTRDIQLYLCILINIYEGYFSAEGSYYYYYYYIDNNYNTAYSPCPKGKQI